MSYIVALTGGIASGKTTIANLFAGFGITLVDADIIAREVIEPGTAALVDIIHHFGPTILTAEGLLDRQKLREIIFSQPLEKAWLNQLIHPLVQQRTLPLFSQAQSPYLIWVIPLLIENNLTHLADRILVVDVNRETQLQRIMVRDGSDRQLAEKILNAQVSRDVRLSYADDVIRNDHDLPQVAERVRQLHEGYLVLAGADVRD